MNLSLATLTLFVNTPRYNYRCEQFRFSATQLSAQKNMPLEVRLELENPMNCSYKGTYDRKKLSTSKNLHSRSHNPILSSKFPCEEEGGVEFCCLLQNFNF